MSDVINTFFLMYAALFPIVNPLGAAPIFLALTMDRTSAERSKLAWRVGVNSFLVLLVSLFLGAHVLEFFGISIPILRIAGGVVVASFGWDLLHAKEGVSYRKAAKTGNVSLEADNAFYPLTLPLTVGPGAISVAITLGSRRPDDAVSFAHVALLATAAVLGIAAISATIFCCYRFARHIVDALGEAGTNVLLRLSAFILFCIGIEIIWSGYVQLSTLAV